MGFCHSRRQEAEGVARELVNRIQNIRKDSGFEVTDKIKLTVLKFKELEESIKENKDYIMNETLTQELELADSLSEGIDVEFDGIVSKILIQKM